MSTPVHSRNFYFNDCYVRQESSILVVSPRSEVDPIEWMQQHQEEIARAIAQYGAIVFSGFRLKPENFSDAFYATTQRVPVAYGGYTPRREMGQRPYVYVSSAVTPSADIPPHQEASDTDKMPRFIAFQCVVPPKEGTGRTEIVDVAKATEDVKKSMPDLWKRLETTGLTYRASYLPSGRWHTRWIRWLNPSHATIQQQFGTENREEVERKCQAEGLTCRWQNGWAVVSRRGVPGTIQVNGRPLFCNQIHIDKLNSKLCGGWVQYFFARLLLYAFPAWMQLDVQFDDGTQIRRSEAARLLTILQRHRVGRDWQEGDFMLLDNHTRMHAKTPHKGPRELLVTMSGS